MARVETPDELFCDNPGCENHAFDLGGEAVQWLRVEGVAGYAVVDGLGADIVGLSTERVFCSRKCLGQWTEVEE